MAETAIDTTVPPVCQCGHLKAAHGGHSIDSPAMVCSACGCRKYVPVKEKEPAD